MNGGGARECRNWKTCMVLRQTKQQQGRKSVEENEQGKINRDIEQSGKGEKSENCENILHNKFGW